MFVFNCSEGLCVEIKCGGERGKFVWFGDVGDVDYYVDYGEK